MLPRTSSNDPWLCKGYYTLALNQYKLGSYDEAIRSANIALSLPENGGGVYIASRQLKLMSYKSLGRTEEAIKAATELAKSKPSPFLYDQVVPGSYFKKASLQMTLPESKGGGALQAAKTMSELAKRCVTEGPGWNSMHAQALEMAGDTYLKAGMTSKALAAYVEYLKNFPRTDESAMIATLKNRIENGSDIENYLKKQKEICLKYPTNSGGGHYALAEYSTPLMSANRFDEALPVLKRVLVYAPKAEDPYYSVESAANAGLNMVMIYLDRKELDHARGILAILGDRFSTQQGYASAKKLVDEYVVASKGTSSNERPQQLATVACTGVLVIGAGGFLLRRRKSGGSK